MCMRNECEMALMKQNSHSGNFCDEERDSYEDTMTIKRHNRERVGDSWEITGGSPAAIGGA